MGRQFNYGEADQTVDSILAELKTQTDAAIHPLKDQIADLKATVRDMQTRAAGTGFGEVMGDRKSLGDEIVEIMKGLNEQKSVVRHLDIDIKNTILGESGDPQNPDGVIVAPQRLPGIVPGAFRALTLLDVIPIGQTGSNKLEYTRENSWTQNAAERAEGTTKPESALTFSLVDEPVRTIAHFIKVSKQALDDSPSLASYINARMSHGVRNRLQSQILAGNGTSPNLAGLTASGRHVAFTPIFDGALDNVAYACDLMRAADYNPTAILMNPLDVGSILRQKIDEDNPAYQLDGGRDIMRGLPAIFGVPVVAHNSVTQGSFFVIDSSQVMLFMRQQVVVEAFEQDSDNVQKNLLTIRAEMRAAFAVFAQAGVQYGNLVPTSD